MYQFLRQACTNLFGMDGYRGEKPKQLQGVNIWLL